jgi:hypothetical protein
MKTKLVGRDCQFSKDSSCSKVKDTVKAQKKDEKHTKQVISKENCFFWCKTKKFYINFACLFSDLSIAAELRGVKYLCRGGKN